MFKKKKDDGGKAKGGEAAPVAEPAADAPKKKPATKVDPEAIWKNQQRIASTWRSHVDKLAAKHDLSDPETRETVRTALLKNTFIPLANKLGIKSAAQLELLAANMHAYLNLKIDAASSSKQAKGASKQTPKPTPTKAVASETAAAAVPTPENDAAADEGSSVDDAIEGALFDSTEEEVSAVSTDTDDDSIVFDEESDKATAADETGDLTEAIAEATAAVDADAGEDDFEVSTPAADDNEELKLAD